jgi:Protein of unknown function (DUF4235)
MPNGAAIAYKPMSLAAGITGGLLAGVIFKQVWRRVSDEQEAPEATDAAYGWGEVVAAAALQGAIFAAIKAIVDRGGANGFRKLTGVWPGEDSTAARARKSRA